MFGWFQRKSKLAHPREAIAAQPPGEIFPWPKGTVLTAVDEVILALPMELFDKDRPMGEFILGSDDLEMKIPPQGDTFLVRLQPGMSISLTKSVQACVVADDKTPRRIKVQQPLQST